MASIHITPITSVPVAVTETRSVRSDNRQIPVEYAVDALPETRKLPDAPKDDILAYIRPVIERLDGQKDDVETVAVEEPDQEDRALQANEAYKTLRVEDPEKTPVGRA
jgi:hypothetical protein